MSGWMTYFTGTRDTKKPAREAIITLRTNLQVLEKKEEYLQKKIDEELKKARANAVSNKAGTSRVDRLFRCIYSQTLSAAPTCAHATLPPSSCLSVALVATAALKRKKAHETELDRLSGQRLTLETQVSWPTPMLTDDILDSVHERHS